MWKREGLLRMRALSNVNKCGTSLLHMLNKKELLSPCPTVADVLDVVTAVTELQVEIQDTSSCS
jgi:hypothetical protein